MEKVDANRFVLRRDNEAVELLLNSDMEGSRLLSVDSDKEIAKKARGRPDISLWKIKDRERKGLLVIECKFSDSPPYLTAGRFKAMAYLYEYGAQAGALVFPELNSERRPYDDEDEGTRGLWRSLTKEGGLLCMSLRDDTGQALYLIRLTRPRETMPRRPGRRQRGGSWRSLRGSSGRSLSLAEAKLP